MSADDVALIQQLHDEYAAVLYRYCLRLTGYDRGRAEDVVQETLLRAWRHLDAFDESRGSVRAWLFTVAHNIVIDQWRSGRPGNEIPVAQMPERVDDSDHTDRLLEGWLVAEALSRISAQHREVIVACYYRDESVAQAASRLGVPAGTIKSRTHYALRELQLVLTEMGVGW